MDDLADICLNTVRIIRKTVGDGWKDVIRLAVVSVPECQSVLQGGSKIGMQRKRNLTVVGRPGRLVRDTGDRTVFCRARWRQIDIRPAHQAPVLSPASGPAAEQE